MPYKYLEDIATADAAFEAEGRTLEEIFTEAAIATFEVMADTRSIKQEISREIDLENDAIDDLLYDWLSELVYLKDADALLFSKFEVRIKKNNTYKLRATAWGEFIDQQKHILRSDVKAVTYHMFEVKENAGNWTARVVLDI